MQQLEKQPGTSLSATRQSILLRESKLLCTGGVPMHLRNHNIVLLRRWLTVSSVFRGRSKRTSYLSLANAPPPPPPNSPSPMSRLVSVDVKHPLCFTRCHQPRPWRVTKWASRGPTIMTWRQGQVSELTDSSQMSQAHGPFWLTVAVGMKTPLSQYLLSLLPISCMHTFSSVAYYRHKK